MNKKAIEELTNLYKRNLINKYTALKSFCLKCDILTIEDFREIEKNVK